GEARRGGEPPRGLFGLTSAIVVEVQAGPASRQPHARGRRLAVAHQQHERGRDPSWHRRRIGVYTPAMQTDVRAMDAVIFDLGGVVLDSPLHAIARYERERGLPANAVNLAVITAGEADAWARLARGARTIV